MKDFTHLKLSIPYPSSHFCSFDLLLPVLNGHRPGPHVKLLFLIPARVLIWPLRVD